MDSVDLLSRILEMITRQHKKLDAVTVSPEVKARSEGYIEALYQVENMINSTVSIKTGVEI